jgi:hypothetical protein
MNLEDLGDALTKINAEFQLPAELLEWAVENQAVSLEQLNTHSKRA